MIPEDEIKRMRWASRRGMLELDLVLEPFVTDCYAELGERDRQCYQRLMECEDQQLFAWFLRREQPEDESLADIVNRILDYKHRSPRA